MTILKKMTSLAINKKHLNVNNDDDEHFQGGRNRPERASSLALPHTSLLDFYDKQQEQCSSLLLLPTNVNAVVRRHSSHYYPMLENKQLKSNHSQQQQQQQQQQQEQQQKITKTSAMPILPPASQLMAAAAAVASTSPHFNYNNKANHLLMQELQSTASLTLSNTVSTRSNDAGKYSTRQAAKTVATGVDDDGSGNVITLNPMMTTNKAASTSSTSLSAPVVPGTPPPPIPKRTFRGKYAWNGIESATATTQSTSNTGSPISVTQTTPTKGKQTTTTAPGNTFVYPTTTTQQQQQQQQHQQQQQQQHNINGIAYFPTDDGSLFVDIKSRSLYSDSGMDAGGISDDDRMSLENSVFDESLTSTPIKVASSGSVGSGGSGGSVNNKFVNSNFAAKSLAQFAGDLSNAAKRSNRSSSSTVDSTTTSSGYGSTHSERFASTSTTADFRSRFSSVDTQSSLESCPPEKANDSPIQKDIYRMDRTMMGEAISDYNSLNNNEVRFNPASLTTNTASNNNTLGRQTTMAKLPAVPLRKQNGKVPSSSAPLTKQAHESSQQSLHNSSSSGSKALSTVSNSTSTSSTASAGSGISSASTMSISTKASNTAISPLTHNALLPQSQLQQQQKRSLPPAPPTRTQNFFDMGTNPNTVPVTNGMRNKLGKHKPPPIVYPKLHQRQDSNLSSDSYSVTSSPGYNSKNAMDTPLLQSASRINKSGPGMVMRHQDSNDSFNMTASHYGFPTVSNQKAQPPPPRSKQNYRQDSNISSDSFSQISSPGYNTKLIEAPLLPSLSVKRLCSVPTPIVLKQKLQNETIEEMEQNVPMSPLTKCVSTPASLQTIVRFQNGTPNTMSLQHQIINRRKSSNPYITNGRLKFRLFQILINAFALLAIAGGLAAYFNAYPTIKFVNKTIINTIHVEEVSSYGKNPAPGTCLPIIVKFCQGPQIPYNYTVFPNYIGHFGQLETQVDLDAYEALVDVRCYELVSLFLCTLFVPKCGATGATVPPCKTLCTETMRRCGFFFDVFGLSLPEYLNCKLFKDFENPEDCVGLDQVREVMIASSNPICDGFQCDQNRCIPKDYVCDGHLDCMDQADEASCERCAKDEIYCGENRCVGKKHICDGVVDCPYGQDERNCIRLSERNGDLGKGVLEVFRIESREWAPACVKNWDRAVSPTAVCSMLGYSSVNATSVVTQKTHRPLLTSVNVSTDIWKSYAKKRSNLMQELSNCKPSEDYPIAELTCANYECGKVKRARYKPSRRIIGGTHSNPGSWPFLAAILGGPEKIFYCAGVLISDQWVLTASHCIGNHTVIDLEDWTIQLGVTRRNSFTYSGQKVKVKTVIPHPQYNTAIAHDNDIALFQLATRVAFHEHLLPVCLPPPGLKQLKSEQMCTVIGWGKREDKDPKSTYEPIVNEVQVPIIKRQVCDEWLDNLTVSEGMICAGYEEGGKDACQGDSGGPLLCPYPGEKDRWFVGGIVSWGIMCAHPKLPGVYANVIKYVPWIQEQIQKYSKPTTDEKLSKFDTHPGGPDILSNIAAGPAKNANKKPFSSQNRSPMDIDYYDNYEKT